MTRRNWNHGGKSAAQRGYGKQHQAIRAELLRTVILCEACQRKTPPRVTAGCIADHIIPLSKGGTGDRSNYQLLCRECAAEKDAKDRGATYRKRPRIDPVTGWPVDDEEGGP